MEKIIINNLAEIDAAAEAFFKVVPRDGVVAFYGAMGAGKTTFITALCKCLGVEDVVNSPTFTIINEYCDDRGDSIFHFDFYRLESLQEAMDIGLNEYLYSGCLCLMEWPEKVDALFDEDVIKVMVTAQDDGTRVVEIYK